MKTRLLLPALFTALCLLGATLEASENAPQAIGVVNFKACVEKSLLGQKEQQSFEGKKNDMQNTLENLKKEMEELATKFRDSDYMDSLSPEAEEEMKTKFHMLSQEMGKGENQYYQTLNQANMKLVHEIATSVGIAAEVVAQEKNLDLVVDTDTCFFFISKIDVTDLVVAEMDKNYTPKSDSDKAAQ